MYPSHGGTKGVRRLGASGPWLLPWLSLVHVAGAVVSGQLSGFRSSIAYGTPPELRASASPFPKPPRPPHLQLEHNLPPALTQAHTFNPPRHQRPLWRIQTISPSALRPLPITSALSHWPRPIPPRILYSLAPSLLPQPRPNGFSHRCLSETTPVLL